MHERVQVGDLLIVSEPKNHFPLAAHAERSLLFAGGIGITPILCMAEELTSAGRTFELHYCGRSRARMAFLERIEKSSFATRLQVHCDDGPPEQRLDAAKAIGRPLSATHLYVCGPTGFMDHVLGAARALGWTEDHLHREYFAAAPVDHSADDSFEIELKLSGRVIVVSAEQSAAEALAAAGVRRAAVVRARAFAAPASRAFWSERPTIATCTSTDEERQRNDSFTPCCSRSLTPRLVLAL